MQLASKLETVTHDPAKSDIHYTYIHTYVCTYVDTYNYTYARMCVYIYVLCTFAQDHKAVYTFMHT